MPLKRGSSRATISSNIKQIMAEGIRGKKVPQKQAVAVALSQARRSRRKR